LVEIRAAHGREVSRLERECALLREQLLAMVGRAEASVQDLVYSAGEREEPTAPELEGEDDRLRRIASEMERKRIEGRAAELGVPVEALMDVPGFGE
jgi:hypothetical protein